MRILAISDIHDDVYSLARLMTENIVDNFDLLMVAGDISNGDPAAVIDILNILGIDVILVRGNHDPLDLGDLGNITELKYG